MHDEDLAATILDRTLKRGRLIHLDGPSGRTHHLNLEGVLPRAADSVRISGIRVPEFLEPATRAAASQLAGAQPASKKPVRVLPEREIELSGEGEPFYAAF